MREWFRFPCEGKPLLSSLPYQVTPGNMKSEVSVWVEVSLWALHHLMLKAALIPLGTVFESWWNSKKNNKVTTDNQLFPLIRSHYITSSPGSAETELHEHYTSCYLRTLEAWTSLVIFIMQIPSCRRLCLLMLRNIDFSFPNVKLHMIIPLHLSFMYTRSTVT